MPQPSRTTPRRAIAATLAAAIVIGGCSTAAKDIAPAYISPLQYQSYDCDQIAAEAQRLQARVTQLGGRLDEAAANDKAITGVGLILFWPALFALGGTKEQEAEYARLRGEYETLQQVAVQKKCPGLAQPHAAAPAATASAPAAPAAPAALPAASAPGR